MYEQMKNEFMMHLKEHGNYSKEDLQNILFCMDLSAYNYDVKKKETQIIPYNQDLPQLCKTFIVCKSIEGYSEGTLYNHTRFLTKFFFNVQKAPEQVTANDIRVYLYTYQKERGITNRSLDKVRASISAFYHWMHIEGYIDKNPCVAIPTIKYDKKPKTFCSQMDLEYLRRACNTLKQKAILEVLYSTGCRVGELVNLKLSDVNWQERTVHLFGKNKKHRTGFLNVKALFTLSDYLNSRNDSNEWLFVSDREPHDQMHTCGIQKIIRNIAKRANLNKPLHPHIFRHTTASILIQKGASIHDIQKILGHEEINTTLNYAKVNMNQVQETHRRFVS